MASIFRVLGEIFVDNAAADKSIDATTEKAEKSGSKIGSAFSSIAKGAVAMGTAVVAGATAIGTAAYSAAMSTAEQADYIDKLSERTGINREELQRWKHAADQSGVSVDSFKNGIKKMSDVVDDANNGSKTAATAIERLGLSLDDLNAMSTEEKFNAITAALADMEDGAERNALGNDLLGKSYTEMLPLLNAGSDGMAALKKEADDLGLVMSESTVKAGVVLGDTVANIKDAFGGLMNRIGAAAIPIIQKFADLIISSLPKIQGLFDRLVPVITNIFDQLLPPLFQLIETLFPVLMDLIMALLPPIESIITAILPVIISLIQQLLPFVIQIVEQVLPIKGGNITGDKGTSRGSPFICVRQIFIMSYEQVISFDSLYKGLKQSCRNIRWKDSTVGYEGNALKNTYRLRQSLLNGKYKIDKYQYFTIFEPKRREIVATRLKDRQFQRALCDNGFYEQITKSFITDNCACLRGRGVDYTLNRMTAHLRRYYNEHGCEGWVLKCDIHHYFQSIRHDVAKAAICKRVKDPMIAARGCEIVDSFGEIGLGLGSQVSQLVALAVLDDLDHYIKERLRVKHYIRYMDDFVLVHPDKAFLQQCRAEIEKQLEPLGLQLNGKTALYPLRQGVKMLQWRFIVTDSGAIIRKMAKKKQGKQRRKLKKLYAKEQSGEYATGTARESLVSFLANAARGDTYHERRKMITFYQELEDKSNAERPIQTPCKDRGNDERSKGGVGGNFGSGVRGGLHRSERGGGGGSRPQNPK